MPETPSWVLQALDLMRRRLAEPLRAPDVAKAVGRSERSLRSAMPAATGKSFGTYLRGLRIERARTLLESGESSIAS